MKLRSIVSAAVALSLAASVFGQQKKLAVGDNAPGLDIEKWVKGSETTIQPGKVYVVEFWATWCGPCRMIAPILDQIAVEHAGKVKITKLDVDANIKTASRFNVRSIPMLLFFKDGKVVDQIVGAVPKMHIEQKLQQHAA